MIVTWSTFLLGIVIGFSIAAPVGPIGILCINRSLHEGYLSGFITGCGAAFADTLYGCIAAFGLKFISELFIQYRTWIHLFGGIFLIYLGLKNLLTHKRPRLNTGLSHIDLLHAFTTTFILTLTNPTTIFSFIAVFAALGLGGRNNTYLESSLLVLGVLLGSLLWWSILSAGVSHLLHSRINLTTLKWINRISGITLILFGLGAMISIVAIR